MKKTLQTIKNELLMPGLTMKQRWIVYYFTLSFGLFLSVTDTTPLWAVGLLLLNFANAARLANRVHLPDNDE